MAELDVSLFIQMPIWVTIIVQLTPAIIAAIIGSLGFYIAYLQYRINRNKLRLDLFEKRLDAYEALQRFFTSMLQHAAFKDEAISMLHEARYKSRFLFGQDIRDHIEELWRKGFEMRNLARKIHGPEALPVGADRSKIVEEEHVILKWFMDQINGSQERYERYLQFD